MSRCTQGPTSESETEMKRVIRWVIDNQDEGLLIEPKFKYDEENNIIWEVIGICDSTWGSNKEDGRSVTGYIVYLQGVPIA